jgi:hypothetical protein
MKAVKRTLLRQFFILTILSILKEVYNVLKKVYKKKINKSPFKRD